MQNIIYHHQDELYSLHFHFSTCAHCLGVNKMQPARGYELEALRGLHAV